MRSAPRILPSLLLVCATAASAAAGDYASELRRDLEPGDPRWGRSLRDLPAGEKHPVLEWVAGRIYIVRPFEPGEGRKAELGFSPTRDPSVLEVRRRTLGTTSSIQGTARLVHHRPRQRGPRRESVLLLEVTYVVKPARGVQGALGGVATGEAETYRARYAVRAKGDSLIGRTQLPALEGSFEEKAVAQGVAYRRTGSLINQFTGESEEDRKRFEELRKEPIVSTCWVSEFSASGEENTSGRRATLRGVRFFYSVPEEIVGVLAADRPKHLFVIAHGWMNGRSNSLDFASKMVRGIQARAEQAGVSPKELAFFFLSWNSKRTVFMESALCAETIGHRELAPMLRSVRERSPGTSVTLLGHSLGGRMMLAALQGPQRDVSSGGKWRRGFFRKRALVGGDALDAPFRRLLHIALRGRQAPAPKVHAAVLFEAAIDVQTLIEPIGVLNYGDTPDATTNVRVLANCHSVNDDILRVAYTAANGVTNPIESLIKLFDSGNGVQAIGRLGAIRTPAKGGTRARRATPAQYFARIKAGAGAVDPEALAAALSAPDAVPHNASGNRVINVDMSGVMPKGGDKKPGSDETWGAVDTHGEFFAPVSFDLIWRVTQEGVKRGAP